MLDAIIDAGKTFAGMAVVILFLLKLKWLTWDLIFLLFGLLVS
jgi:hypothetical protein